MIQTLKTAPEYMDAVISGRKPFEVRQDDRAYEDGDILCLVEFDAINGVLGSRVSWKMVTYVLRGPKFGIEKGFCVMGLRDATYEEVMAQ